MKKLLIILFSILFITCESSTLGVDENQGISYYDCLAFGWQAFFDKDYELALDYFETAYEATDEDFHNSAHSAIGWTYLFIANEEIGDDAYVEELRFDAYEEFLFDDNESYAIESYGIKCPYTFCCDNCFSQDRNLGLLIYNIESYFYSENQDSSVICVDQNGDGNCEDGLIFDLKEFILENRNYDFMNGKPEGSEGESVDLFIDHIIVYLAQNYLRIDNYSQACVELLDENLSCGIQDCENFNITELLDCIQGDFPF